MEMQIVILGSLLASAIAAVFAFLSYKNSKANKETLRLTEVEFKVLNEKHECLSEKIEIDLLPVCRNAEIGIIALAESNLATINILQNTRKDFNGTLLQSSETIKNDIVLSQKALTGIVAQNTEFIIKDIQKTGYSLDNLEDSLDRLRDKAPEYFEEEVVAIKGQLTNIHERVEQQRTVKEIAKLTAQIGTIEESLGDIRQFLGEIFEQLDISVSEPELTVEPETVEEVSTDVVKLVKKDQWGGLKLIEERENNKIDRNYRDKFRSNAHCKTGYPSDMASMASVFRDIEKYGGTKPLAVF